MEKSILGRRELNVKAVVDAFNQEKALVGAFSVITNFRMDLFEALVAKYIISGTCLLCCNNS